MTINEKGEEFNSLEIIKRVFGILANTDELNAEQKLENLIKFLSSRNVNICDQESIHIKKEYLKHLVNQCLKAVGLLNRVNTEFRKDWEEFRIALEKGLGSAVSSSSQSYPLDMLNTVVKEYLIIKVASLFYEDKNKESISLYNILDRGDVDRMKGDNIIAKIMKIRNKLVAHNDYEYLNMYLEDSNYGLSPADIIYSNLEKILERCQELLRD